MVYIEKEKADKAEITQLKQISRDGIAKKMKQLSMHSL